MKKGKSWKQDVLGLVILITLLVIACYLIIQMVRESVGL